MAPVTFATQQLGAMCTTRLRSGASGPVDPAPPIRRASQASVRPEVRGFGPLGGAASVQRSTAASRQAVRSSANALAVSAMIGTTLPERPTAPARRRRVSSTPARLGEQLVVALAAEPLSDAGGGIGAVVLRVVERPVAAAAFAGKNQEQPRRAEVAGGAIACVRRCACDERGEPQAVKRNSSVGPAAPPSAAQHSPWRRSWVAARRWKRRIADCFVINSCRRRLQAHARASSIASP